MEDSVRASEGGFTLVELAVVMAILAILVTVGAVKYVSMVERSREAATKANLSTIRCAISIYYGDREGVFPQEVNVGGESAFSRYLDKVPPVCATHVGVGAGAEESPEGNQVLNTDENLITAAGVGWRYVCGSGLIYVNSSATDSRGEAYSSYGY